MFGKKKKENVDSTMEAKVSVEPKQKVKKKRKDGLYPLFHESVLETVIAMMSENVQFIDNSDRNNPKYGCLVLDVKDIGGLDKKTSKRDEAKGQLVEMINAGQLPMYISEDTLENNLLVFIPTASAVVRMEEFSMLTDAEYELCLVNVNGDIMMTGTMLTYMDVVEFLDSEKPLSYLLHDNNDSNSMMDDDIIDDDMEDESMEFETSKSENFDDLDFPEDNDVADDEIPDDDEVDEVSDADEIPDVDDNIDFYEESEESESEEDTSFSESSLNEDGYEDAYEAAMQEPVQQEEQEIPEEWTTEAIVRKFYSDDLGLEVSLDPFDAQFVLNNPFTAFETNRPDGWLNNQLNEMCRMANAEMQKMHQDNLFILRNYYFKLLSAQCNRIVDDLSTDSDETQYGRLSFQLLQEKQEMLRNIGPQVERRRAEMEQDWKNRLQEIGMQAARDAQRDFRDKYGREHEIQMSSIEDAIKSSIHADFKDAEYDLNMRRRQEANALLDLSITEVMDELTHMYTSFINEEHVRYTELQNQISAFIEDNRKEDIARTHALEEQLRQGEEADRVLAQQTAKIREMTEEFAAKKKDLLSDIAALRAENKNRLDSCEKDAERRVQNEKDEREKLQRQFDNLMEKYTNLDEVKEQQFKNLLVEKDNEIEAWKARNIHMEDAHKKNNLMTSFLIIAIAIAFFAIGYIGGEWMNSRRDTKSQMIEYQNSLQKDAPTTNSTD